MSKGSAVRNLSGFAEVEEWLDGLGLLPAGQEKESIPIQEKLKSGVILCQLVNMIKPGGVDIVRKKKLFCDKHPS